MRRVHRREQGIPPAQPKEFQEGFPTSFKKKIRVIKNEIFLCKEV